MKLSPSKIIGLGYNYKISYPDGNYPAEPVIFLKGNNTLIGDGDSIIYPKNVNKVWIEAELAYVVGEGYTIANDVTAENIEGRDHHLARSKSLDTFCSISSIRRKYIDADNLNYKVWINDKLVQDANTGDMIWGTHTIIWKLSNIMTLNEGDIILTGTHPGYAKLGEVGHIMTDGIIKRGDVIRIEFDELGILENEVI